MSGVTRKPETAKDVASAAPSAAPAKITVARLRRDCLKVFGVSTSTFDGACVGLKPDAEFNVDEMRQRIKKWQDTPVTRKEAK